ncbi:MAG TPA: glycosyltransferase family 4 protein [Tepidisphaeraceae bacterium]|nr:glycosyltransferase family 4 protein [Tepidisphaeraceae bacterium]
MSAPPCLLVSGDFVKTGGMDRANHALASHLARSGREVHIVAFGIDDELRRTPGIVFHPVPKPGGSYTLALPLLDGFGRRWAKRLTSRSPGARVIVNGGCSRWGDVNWVHYVHAAHRPQVRRGMARWLASEWNHHRWLHDERAALTQARIVIANSQRTRRDVIERLGVDPARVKVVYLGVDADRFAPATADEKMCERRALGLDEHRPIVAFIGAMSDRRKGFDLLFDAWAMLCRDGNWDAQLLVVGAGAEVPAWQSAAAAVGVESRMRFLGLRDDVPRILRASDLLVAPARYEAYGLSVHEALCCGVPAMVSESAGVAERFTPAMSGWLLPDRLTPAHLAARLRDWQRGAIGGVDQLPALSNTLRAHTWDEMAAEISRFMS